MQIGVLTVTFCARKYAGMADNGLRKTPGMLIKAFLGDSNYKYVTVPLLDNHLATVADNDAFGIGYALASKVVDCIVASRSIVCYVLDA